MKKRENNEIVYSYDDFFPSAALGFNSVYVHYGNLFERKKDSEKLDEIIFYALKGNEYEFYIINQEPEAAYNQEGTLFLNFKGLNPIKLTEEVYTFSQDGYNNIKPLGNVITKTIEKACAND